MSAARRASLGAALAALVGLGCAHARPDTTVSAPDADRWIVIPNVKLVAQDGDTDCGPAALATALARWGAAAAPDAWQPRPGEPRTPDGVTAGALRDVARRAGFQSFVFEGTFDDLASEVGAGRPVIVGLVRVERDERTPHFAVVVGHDAQRGRWLLADPALGVMPVATEALRADWGRSGWVTLVVYPNEVAAMVDGR